MRGIVLLMMLFGSLLTESGINQLNDSTGTSPSSVSSTLVPTADAYVSSATPTTNFGRGTQLVIDRSPITRSFLRFDARSITGRVEKAVLRVYVTSANPTGFQVYPVRSTWDESRVTSVAAPRLGPNSIAVSGKVTANQWVEIDITNQLRRPSLVDLALMTTSTTAITLSSREATATAPQLVIYTGGATNTNPNPPAPAPAPPAPSPTPAPTPPAPPSPTPPTAIGPGAITLGQLALTSTLNSIGVEMFFSGDPNANATAALEFKPTSSTTWRAALPLWQTNDGSTNPGPAYYGSALLLDPGTSYDIRVTVADPDGVSGNPVLTGSIATQADNIPAAATLVPTHYVSANGNDANAGTSTGSAWKTLEKAVTAAPAGAVVVVGPGSYAPPTTVRTTPITLVAEKPAVNDAREPINAGQRAVIEPQTFSSLAGAGAGVETPWTQVTLTGPATGNGYSVWKWTGAPIDAPTSMTVAATRGEQPIRVAYWDRQSRTFESYTMSSPEGWAEVLYENETYNYGFTSFGTDVYLRLPDDRNPNELFVTLHYATGQSKGMVLNASDSRVTGFEIRMVGTFVLPNAARGVFDHNLLSSAELNYQAEKGSPSKYPINNVVQYNRMMDTSLWSTDPSIQAIPWLFIKQDLRLNGKETPWRRVGGLSEVAAVTGQGGANQLVIRYNTIEGYFNGVNAYSPGFDRYAKSGYDIYGNTIRNIADDALEPDKGAINWRVWDNRIESISIAVSIAPLNYGPLYLFRNEIWQLGNAGVGADGRGEKLVGANGFKYSGESTPTGRVYIIHNTFWTNAPEANGGSEGGGGAGSSESFYLRNNIFRLTRYAFAGPGLASRWDEDYNYFYTADPKRGIEVGGKNYPTVGEYKSGTGDGANTNVSGDFRTDVRLNNAPQGDLTLPNGSPLIDAGTPIPNISDRPGVDYRGNAPDLGANER